MKAARTAKQPVEFNVTPMIDVVFLLIIFFLVSSHLAQQETQQELQLPAASTGGVAEDSAPRVTINVLPSGEVLLGAEPTPLNQLTQRLRNERDRLGPGLEVRLRADRKAVYAAVEPVLLACSEAGVWNLGFAVKERD